MVTSFFEPVCIVIIKKTSLKIATKPLHAVVFSSMAGTSVSFTGEFSPNPYLKNMDSNYRKDFP
jgi:hypothetical protein